MVGKGTSGATSAIHNLSTINLSLSTGEIPQFPAQAAQHSSFPMHWLVSTEHCLWHVVRASDLGDSALQPRHFVRTPHCTHARPRSFSSYKHFQTCALT
jgi:hypothetical protein